MRVPCGIFLGVIYLHLAQARIGTFWHVTDFHLDVNYTTDGDPSSMCWQESSDFRFVPEGPADLRESPGEYGNYLCDAPMKLVRSAVAAMEEIHPDPDFIIWTGDDTAHVDDAYFDTDKVVDIIGQITGVLLSSFPNTTFLPILGNHDYYPKNQLPPGKSELQSSVADLWEGWLEELDDGEAEESFRSSGRYVVDLEDSIVSVMALNTLIWYKSNNSTAFNSTADDPDGQFAWADENLIDLAKRGRKVYLIGHIPPGTFERYQQKREGFHWYQDRYNERFIKLIQDHGDVIEAQFFAHHHTDSFRLFFEDDNRDENAKPLSYQLLAPGVTPWKSTLSEETGANNPGIRLISYDTETGELTEITTYFLDLSKANSDQAEWVLEYNFTSYYGLEELSPKSLFTLSREMMENKELFDKYYLANTVRYEYPSACTSKCHQLHWCSITEIDYKRFYECNSATTLLQPWAIFLTVIFQCILMLR